MADYYVECVCLDEKERIEALKLRDTETQQATAYRRHEVIEMIDVYGKDVIVPDRESYERPRTGARVVTFTNKNGTWLRTDPNETEADNLENANQCSDDECIGIGILWSAGLR